jgi:hypothetical protein
MGLLDKVEKKVETNVSEKVEEKKKEGLISEEEVLSWFNETNKFLNKKVCMILGADGTGKSGLVLHYISERLKEDKNAKAVILDLDQGCSPLLRHYPDIADRIIIKDPVRYSMYEDENEVKVDMHKLMNVIKKVAITISKNHKKLGIKYFVLDGLSKLLEVAESQMRVDINKEISDGIQTQYWKRRKEHFFGVLDILKALPMDTFYIGHTNFILTDKTAAVPTQTNAMMFQRIICERDDDLDNGTMRLFAHITKSKLNPLKENKRINFMAVKDNTVKFDSSKVFEGL